MPDKCQPIATDFFRRVGFSTIKSNDGMNWLKKGKSSLKLPAESGRADMQCTFAGRTVFVELKDDVDSFTFSRWEKNQRHWASQIEAVYQTEYWLFLELGRGTRGSKKRTKLAWLMPHQYMLDVERRVSPYQDSIPFSFNRGKPGSYKLALRENGLDAVTVFAPFEIQWQDGGYTLPESHPFRVRFNPPMKDLRKEWIPFNESPDP